MEDDSCSLDSLISEGTLSNGTIYCNETNKKMDLTILSTSYKCNNFYKIKFT